MVDCSRPGQERDRPYKAQATAPQVRPLGLAYLPRTNYHDHFTLTTYHLPVMTHY